jgi:Kef-type K+ transport system membrane component KefB
LGVSVVEALTYVIVTLVILYVMELTIGTVMDWTYSIFMNLTFTATYSTWTLPILEKFEWVHRSMGFVIVAVCIWALRSTIFQSSYSRGRY